MARHDVIRHVDLYHAPPPPMPEDLLEGALRREPRPRRFHWTVDDSPGRERPDLPFSFGGELILSPRACRVLLPLIEPWVWLERDVEIDGARGYVAAVLTERYDCLEQQRSTGTRGTSSGAWIEVQRLVLQEAAIGPAPVFRLPTRTLQWRPMLAGAIVRAIEAHGLTGLTFLAAEIAPRGAAQSLLRVARRAHHGKQRLSIAGFGSPLSVHTPRLQAFMSIRSRAVIGVSSVAILIVGCASTPSSRPAPHAVDAAALTIKVDLRLPLQAWLKSADKVATTVFFVKECPPSDSPCDEKLIPSNHESQGRVYLLNVEPGEYRPVAAAYESAVYYVIGASHVVNVVYLPDALVSNTGVPVQAGRLSDAGHHRVEAVNEVCAATADPGQLRYAELMEPGVRKCGLLGILVDSLRHPIRSVTSPLVIGNKAFPTGTGANHFRGVSHETLRGAQDAQALEEARKDLEREGWSFEQRP